jgi:hypothetical protein
MVRFYHCDDFVKSHGTPSYNIKALVLNFLKSKLRALLQWLVGTTRYF